MLCKTVKVSWDTTGVSNVIVIRFLSLYLTWLIAPFITPFSCR